MRLAFHSACIVSAPNAQKSVHMHFHYVLFAEMLLDLAQTVASLRETRIRSPHDASRSGESVLPQAKAR
jgi:hypothetical protein